MGTFSIKFVFLIHCSVSRRFALLRGLVTHSLPSHWSQRGQMEYFSYVFVYYIFHKMKGCDSEINVPHRRVCILHADEAMNRR